MREYRPYRFPSLLQLGSAGAPQSGGMPFDPQVLMEEQYQQAAARGFQEGCESGFEQGHQKGYDEGFRLGVKRGFDEGRQQALADFENLAAPLDAVLASLRQLQTDYQAALRRELVDLVAKVARQVIRCELALQPMQVLTLVEETLASMPPSNDKIEVYLNPQDLERIRDLDLQRADQWSLLADPRLESGECRVKGGNHEADAGCRQRLKACMQQIEEQLLGEEAGAALDIFSPPDDADCLDELQERASL